LLIFAPLALLDRPRGLWVRAAPTDHLASDGSDDGGELGEDDLYRQSQLLNDTLAKIMPGHPGIVDLYFVGVAGYGDQDVFKREVNEVAQLFDRRFGTAGRSIMLINNRGDKKGAPLASVTSLGAALSRVGTVMNRDEDVLFFPTSHGSKDHRFSLDLWPIKFRELDPKRLRRLLDESGIKHRVLVISACYSGGFVDALRNEDTVVITASVADRNSFGCSNEAESTYFGKAYFDDALRQTHSFTQAFEIAKPAVAAREVAENHVPSDPQIAVGVRIGAKLAQWERQRGAQQPRKPCFDLQSPGKLRLLDQSVF
jgi:hypothetical protein